MIMLHKYILLKQNLKPKTWEEVSEEIGYSRTSVIEHAKKGIRDIYTNHKK
jgi:biotin operon repressor